MCRDSSSWNLRRSAADTLRSSKGASSYSLQLWSCQDCLDSHQCSTIGNHDCFCLEKLPNLRSGSWSAWGPVSQVRQPSPMTMTSLKVALASTYAGCSSPASCPFLDPAHARHPRSTSCTTCSYLFDKCAVFVKSFDPRFGTSLWPGLCRSWPYLKGDWLRVGARFVHLRFDGSW